MKKTAEEAVQQLLKDKDLNLHLGDSTSFSYGRIPFDIPVLDKLTGGGIPKKRFTLIYGPTNVGKSYLASQVVVNAQKQGGLAAWVDTELSWDASWMSKCGVDTANTIVSQPTNGEDAFKTIRALMQAGVDVIVLDSIAGLVPTAVAEEEFSYNPMAWQARFVNSSLPKLLAHLHHGSAFIAINQVRASLGPVSLDAMPGGMAQSFFAHFLIQVRRKGWIKEQDANVGFDMEIRLRKTKVGGENWNSAVVPFRVSGGIDVLESYIREGISQKQITQAGAWYTYKDTKVMGLNGVKKFFIENDGAFQELKHELLT
jgi:recombination protein RecA